MSFMLRPKDGTVHASMAGNPYRTRTTARGRIGATVSGTAAPIVALPLRAAADPAGDVVGEEAAAAAAAAVEVEEVVLMRGISTHEVRSRLMLFSPTTRYLARREAECKCVNSTGNALRDSGACKNDTACERTRRQLSWMSLICILESIEGMMDCGSPVPVP